jgi:putative ABC transport system permease protein
LPFKDPNRIVAVWAKSTNSDSDVVAYPDYVDLRDQNQSFSAMTCYTRTAGTLSRAEDSQYLEGVATTPEIFDVLGVPPLLGRGFTREEATEGGPRVVVLTHQLWQRAFGSDAKILGQDITLSGRPHTVVGIMPQGWKFPVEDERIDYVSPVGYLPTSALNNRGAQFLSVTARLKPGVSIAQAQAEASAIMARLSAQHPNTNMNRTAAIVRSLHADVTGNVRPALFILLGAVALVLLIACANVANLLLARAASRSREIAIRAALGASRVAVVRQLLSESLLLALVGGACGLLFAWWGLDVLSSLGPRGLPHLGAINVNLTVCAFTFAVAVASTLLFGLVPALQVSRPNVNDALQQGSKGTAGGLHTSRVRALLVVSQVSLSLLLLAGAGLLVRSFFNLRSTDVGFNPERAVTASLTLPRIRYPEPDQQIRAYDGIMQRVAAIPGVERAAAISTLPLSEDTRTSAFTVSGAAPLARGNHPNALYFAITPDYFEAMRIPLRAGRKFNDMDREKAPPVVIVNEAFARRFWPDRDAVGQQVFVDEDENTATTCEVVGVVGNTKHNSLAEAAAPHFYRPFPQDPSRSVEFVIRTNVAALAGLEGALKRAVQQTDKDLFVANLKPISAVVDRHLAQPRFNMVLLGAFAGVAMVLAAIGIYGVIAYSVAQRTREIGIRMALGAQRGQMLQMILRQSLTLVAVGLALGLFAALGATRVLATLLYGVGASDVSTYALVVLLLAGAASLASYIPARRAMRVDPMVALRYE